MQQPLFNQLSDTVKTGAWYSSKSDKEILADCIAKMDTYDIIFKSLPNNSDLKGKLKIQKDTLDEQLRVRVREQELREKAQLEQLEQPQQRVARVYDAVSRPTTSSTSVGFRHPPPQFSNTALNPTNSQNAGKSRRRHRRGRTLHKRRKSRKVRKTGCRRK